MKKSLILAAIVASTVLNAGAITFNSATLDADDINLDHSKYYTWGFNSVTIPENSYIAGATLTLNNVNNWSANENGEYQWKWVDGKYQKVWVEENWLRLYLLDTANNPNRSGSEESLSGTLETYSDTDNGSDKFASGSWSSISTHIATYSDHDGGDYGDEETLVYSFTALGLLDDLTAYINNGNNFALGFDPDCHYDHGDITLSIVYAQNPNQPPMPDAGSTLWLLGLSLGILPGVRRWFRS